MSQWFEIIRAQRSPELYGNVLDCRFRYKETEARIDDNSDSDSDDSKPLSFHVSPGKGRKRSGKSLKRLPVSCLFYQGSIIQNFQLYLTGTPMNIAMYLSWYNLETQGVL